MSQWLTVPPTGIEKMVTDVSYHNHVMPVRPVTGPYRRLLIRLYIYDQAEHFGTTSFDPLRYGPLC